MSKTGKTVRPKMKPGVSAVKNAGYIPKQPKFVNTKAKHDGQGKASVTVGRGFAGRKSKRKS
jgi:hypothetical protein